MEFATTDLVILVGYLCLMMGFGIWIANREKNESAKDYFLASSSLPWWAVGGSLIASNISAEQIIGMNGSGFELGMAIATYELMAALTLIIVAKYLIPVFLKEGIYTMPQFLEVRFDGRSRSLMSVFWVALFVFVNITSVLYLGGLAIQALFGYDINIVDLKGLTPYLKDGANLVVGTAYEKAEIISNLADGTNVNALLNNGLTYLDPQDNKVKEVGALIQRNYNFPLTWGILGLVLYSAVFSIFGGLKAVVWTDVIQVVVLVVGGAFATYWIVDAVSPGGFMDGLSFLMEKTPERFNMLLSPGDTYVDTITGNTKDAYSLLPGFSVLFGGMWIANMYYWGNNQYIIQRALASKNLKEAQKGVAFAAFMKIFMPLIVVIPGIAAFVLNADITRADEAFPWVLNNHVAVGFKGLVFAALIAAIGSSVSSMVNSASTIFTLDIYKKHINTGANENELVRMGRISAAAALVVGALLGPMLGNFGQIFQFIQEYTGFISPGVVVVFIFGMFWKRATANAAFLTILLAIPLSIAVRALAPDLPFIDRMGIIFMLSSLLMVGVSLFENKTKQDVMDDSMFRIGLVATIIGIPVATGVKFLIEGTPIASWITWSVLALSTVLIALLLMDRKGDDPKALKLDKSLFKTDTLFNVTTFVILIILAFIYAKMG